MAERASVLIVDDNVSLCQTMSFILRRKGYAVDIAKGGGEAIAKVEEKPFDIIFLDIKMTPMDGVETYRRIKKLRPEAVVMMMTAYSLDRLVKEALQEGAFGVIYKPLDIERIMALIERISETKEGALILVVDDDPGTISTLKNTLVKGGYQVGIARSGGEAIAAAQEALHAIIFIEMKLPTINGLEVYLAIKEINPEAVAVMMTADRQEVADVIDEALGASAHTCLYKPLDMAKVLGLIDGILERRPKVV